MENNFCKGKNYSFTEANCKTSPVLSQCISNGQRQEAIEYGSITIYSRHYDKSTTEIDAWEEKPFITTLYNGVPSSHKGVYVIVLLNYPDICSENSKRAQQLHVKCSTKLYLLSRIKRQLVPSDRDVSYKLIRLCIDSWHLDRVSLHPPVKGTRISIRVIEV